MFDIKQLIINRQKTHEKAAADPGGRGTTAPVTC